MDISLKERLKSGMHSYYQEPVLSQERILNQEGVLNHLKMIKRPPYSKPNLLPRPPSPMREWRFN